MADAGAVGPSPGHASRVSAVTVAGIAVASALVPLNSTMIAVALPEIADAFDIAKGRAGVLITVYLAAMLVGQPVAGRVADSVGPRRTAMGSLLGLGACSALAVLPGSFPVLVALRAGQAVFASALAPSVQSMLRAITAPGERGRAFGLLGSILGVGAALGPVLGGLLIAGFGWRAVFAVNVPIVVGVLLVLRRTAVTRSSIDRAALGASTADAEAPSLWNRHFTAAFSTQALVTLAQYALLLIAPMVLDARGWGSGSIGLALSLLTVGMIVMSPTGGRMGDRYGRRRPVLIGLAVAAVAVAVSAAQESDVATTALLVTLALFGLGVGGATPSLMTAGVEAAPEHRVGLAAGLISMSRYVGSIVASLALTAFVTDGAGATVTGAGTLLALALAGTLASLGTATQLPSTRSAVVATAPVPASALPATIRARVARWSR
jgi:MFS family permease